MWWKLLLAVLAIAALAAGVKFSGVRRDLAQQQRQIAEEWTQVEAAMHRRADALPGMLDALEEVRFDRTSVEAVRRSLAAAAGPEAKIRANRELSLVLAKVLLACETDARLRRSGEFRRLRDELAAREDEIAVARFQYNNALEHYNARMQRFPVNVVASLAGFSRNDAYFGTGPDAATAPKAP